MQRVYSLFMSLTRHPQEGFVQSRILILLHGVSSSCMMWWLTSRSFLKCSCNPYPPSEDCLPQSAMVCVLPRQSNIPHLMLTKEIIKRCLGDECKFMNHSVIEKRPCDFRAVSSKVLFMFVVLNYSIYTKRSLPVTPQSL